MSFSALIDEDKFIAQFREDMSSRLSVAILLIDSSTKKQPAGDIRVKIKEGNIKAIKNQSGYYIFTGLTGTDYTVRVESELYIPVEESVHLNPNKPVKKITIKPVL